MTPNWKDIKEIESFARKLESSTISEQNSPYKLENIKETKNKGGFGQYLENAYFGLETNNLSRPDFYPIPLELKTTPLKHNSKNELVPKERLVLNIIDYLKVANEKDIYSSTFLKKNENLLIVWYIHGSASSYKDIKIAITGIWQCLKEDKNQIIADWNYIIQKIKDGKAHELSEGDTLYLGACTKGDNSLSSYRHQYGTDILAKQRAFCFKIQYMQIIYKKMMQKTKSQKVLRRFCNGKETIQEKILNLLYPYIGKTISSIAKKFKITQSKDIGNKIILHILGTDGKKPQNVFYEFAASDIQIKTITINENGKNKQSMSFPAIKYCNIVNEDWEESELFQQLTRKFICPIFLYDKSKNDYIFDRCTIWNMPQSDLDIVGKVWEDTKNKIIRGIYTDFTKLSDDRIVHIRPHARNKEDKMLTPQNTLEGKKCFWLNSKYIFKNIISKKSAYSI